MEAPGKPGLRQVLTGQSMVLLNHLWPASSPVITCAQPARAGRPNTVDARNAPSEEKRGGEKKERKRTNVGDTLACGSAICDFDRLLM